jgi:hypothetical protein
MTKRLHERFAHRIAAELLVADDRARDPLESRSIATVDDLELLEGNRPSAMSQRVHADVILECRSALLTRVESREGSTARAGRRHPGER